MAVLTDAMVVIMTVTRRKRLAMQVKAWKAVAIFKSQMRSIVLL